MFVSRNSILCLTYVTVFCHDEGETIIIIITDELLAVIETIEAGYAFRPWPKAEVTKIQL